MSGRDCTMAHAPIIKKLELEEVTLLTDIQLAQFAQNIIDEGTFFYLRPIRPVYDTHHRPYWAYYPELTVTMGDKENIEYFAKLLGVGSREFIKGRRQFYIYHVYSGKLLSILPRIRPYLRGEKGKQADTILRYGVIYIPHTEPPLPRYISLVREEITKYAQRNVKIKLSITRVGRDEEKVILRLAESGLSIRKIARETGRSRATILRVLRKYVIRS